MKKSTSYRETFRQHRKLLGLPIIVAVVIGGWFGLGAPKSYESTTSLWVDIPGSTTSSLLAATPPVMSASSQEQGIVKELLSTNSFLLAVGHQSSLAAYLAANPSRGWGPTALLSKLGGGGPVNSQILSALGPKQVTITTSGPQVVQINYFGPTPSVAQSTLQAIVRELQAYSARFTGDSSQASAEYYNRQVQAASQAVTTARDNENAYRRQHPGATSSDPQLSALTAAVGTAETNLSQATTNLNQARSGAAAGSPVHVIDSPSLPGGPTSGTKKALEGILGGLFAGLLISFLGTIALTRGRADPWEDELELPAEAAGRNGGPVEPASSSVAVATTPNSSSSLVAGRLSVPARRSVRKPDADAD